jgi:hypothetical protein
MTAWGPRPSGVAFWTSATRFLEVAKSTKVSAPSCSGVVLVGQLDGCWKCYSDAQGDDGRLTSAHLLLLITGINGNGPQTHHLRVLTSQRPKPTARTNDRYELTRLRTRLFQTLVHGDTSAQDRCDGSKVTVLGDPRNVSRFGNAVLLERAVDGVAREQRLGAERLVGLLAEAAGKAGPVEPLDTRVVADFNVVDKVAFCDYDASALVAADEREFGSLVESLVMCTRLVLEV